MSKEHTRVDPQTLGRNHPALCFSIKKKVRNT